MNSAERPILEPRELARTLLAHWKCWLTIAVLSTAAAVAYAVLAPKSWQATQALIVRNEAVGNDAETARLRGPEELKSVQETIMELSKSRAVLRATLLEAGPPADFAEASAWPTDKAVESLQKAVKISPPKGIEFGTSEVFYLEVRDKDRQRAVQLNTVLGHQLQLQLQEIRDTKAQSMIDELNKAVQLARADLQAATAQLTALEQDVGSDLPELRSLLDANSSDTSLRRTVSEIENELRQHRTTEKANRQLLSLLKESQSDPARLIAAPNRLLDSQPALRRLKDGLVDAQLRTARLLGRMSAYHPEVMAAKDGENEVAGRLHDELATAIRGLESELAFDASRLGMLERQRADTAARLSRLAGLRATYANLLSEAANRAKLLERAEQNLTIARSSSASAWAASQISAVDAPDTGTNPVSPGGSVIVLGGLLGGLLTGFAVVLLTASAPAAPKTEPPTAAESSAADAPRSAPMTALAPRPVRVYQQPADLLPMNADWNPAVAVYGDLTCRKALKILNDRGQFA